MADLKISQLSSATALAGTEVVPVVQGGSTKKATIDQILAPASGKGIDFSAAGGDTLKMYDEGTWTPVLRGSGTAGTYETQLLVGTYTRVGRMVLVECIIRLAASITGGGTGYAQITGLPFSIAANSAATGAVAFEGVDWTAGTNLVVRPITLSATTTLFFPEIADNASSSSVQISGFSASDHIYFSLMYQTT